ncbi:TolC family protein [bacterium]|nr:TolC family protein [bacterium]RQV92044.1 MAG: TolC family protein [bacterium]
MKCQKHCSRWISMIAFSVLILSSLPLYAQRTIDLTLESAVEIMMNNSYQIKQLEMGIERTRLLLKAERAGLKSKVYMNLQSPDLNNTSDYKWNSNLQRNEIVRENSTRWQMDLAIRQPVILFGYPTNGNIAINYRVYRYNQRENGDNFINYYNRLYLSFEQPLFQPNRLKNDLEEAELDLEEDELRYLSNQVRTLQSIAGAYYNLFEIAYQDIINNHYVNNLNEIKDVALDLIERDSTRVFDQKQIELVISNAQNELMKNQTDIRLEKARMIQRLSLNQDDIVEIDPEISVTPIVIDEEQAINYGMSLRPSMRLLAIRKRMEEISFEYTKANDAIRFDLEMTYGLEKDDERYRQLFNDFDNSNSITLNAYIPIWDWGRRKARIQAGEIELQQIDLDIEETEREIRTTVVNVIKNVNEYQVRILNLENSVAAAEEITDHSLEQYQNNQISLQDILQIVSRQKETEENFLEAYLDYRESFLDLLESTYYNYETNMSLIDELHMREGL